MQNDEVILRELRTGESFPYDLLLLADPSKEKVESYISRSCITVADSKGETIGCCAFCFLNDDTVEIKNIAVREKNQRKGTGGLLLRDVVEKARAKGVKKIIVGTGNSSIKPLYLYQKAGFRITEIKRNFFTENYRDRIVENGIECIDLIVLTMRLDTGIRGNEPVL